MPDGFKKQAADTCGFDRCLARGNADAAADPNRGRNRLRMRRDINCNTCKGFFVMPGQLKKTRAIGAFVISMSLIFNPISAAGAPALSPIGRAPTGFTGAIDGAEVFQIQHRRGDGVRHRGDRRHERRAERHAEARRYRHGHRGYREYRPGYRRDNDGWWFPLAAFALGAVIITQQNRAPSYSQSYTPSYGNWNHIPSGNMAAHDTWCDRQYRSYDRSSKTFQPYNGPRRYCNSPYDLL